MTKSISALLTLFALSMGSVSAENITDINTGKTAVKDTVALAVPETAKTLDQFPTLDDAVPIDTLDTQDKFMKIILYKNKTWAYLDMGKPQIDSTEFFSCWITDEVHTYKNVKLKDFDDEILLVLADSSNFCAPYRGKVTSGFKSRRSRDHKGIDISLDRNDTIRAAFDGVVRVSLPTIKTGGYGNLVVIRHNNGLETYYAHLNQRLVEPGEAVKAGEIIGLGGNTGRSTGPHLHFETRYKGHPFDPQRIFDFESGDLRINRFVLKKHYFSIYSHYGQSDAESKAASGRIVHKVRSGDTLGSLAVKYGTTVKRICQLNNINTKTVLSIGRRLIVR